MDLLRDYQRQPIREIPKRDILRTPEREIPLDLLRDFPRRPVRRITRRPPKTPKKPPILPTRRRKIIKQPVGKSPSYNVFVKNIKGKKFSRVNKSPISYNDARDLSAYAIDKSVARTSYLKPSAKRPMKSQFLIPKGYYKQTKSKYRDWRQIKKKRYKMKKDKIIERSRYLIDSGGEKRGLSVFKLLSQRRKKADDFANPFANPLIKNQKKKKNSKKKKLNNAWEMP